MPSTSNKKEEKKFEEFKREDKAVISEPSLELREENDYPFIYDHTNYQIIKAPTSRTYSIGFTAPAIYGRAYQSADLNSIADDVPTPVNFNTESFSSGLTFDSVGYSYTIVTAGQYRVSAVLRYGLVTTDKTYSALIYVDGVEYSRATTQSSSTSSLSATITDILNLAVGQVVKIVARHVSGTTSAISSGTTLSYFAIEKIN